MLFPKSLNEAERLFALHELAILDTPPSPAIDRICRIARQVFDVPMVFVTLLDAHRQWFKAKPTDAEITETSREDAFCNYTILHEEVFVVPDAQADRTFARNRYVAGEPYIRFYAGAPLTIRRGVHLGSLYVLDTQPREFSLDQTRLLKGLGTVALTLAVWRTAASRGAALLFLFKRRRFPVEIILLCVRWYCRYGISYRDLAEMMQERGVVVDPSTIFRWVQRYAPEIEKRVRRYQGYRSGSWRVDETYVRVGGKWKYLFRAVDKHGQLIDFMLSDRRNTKAAYRFLRKP